jgi:16S rRNA processing protein RimM
MESRQGDHAMNRSAKKSVRRPAKQRPRREASENVLVGQVHRAHGLRGEVRVEIHSDVPERFAVGAELLLVRPDGATDRVRIRSFRPVKGGALVVFAGISDRDAAEALKGSRLEVEPDEVPEAPEGFYYYWQLTGCRCVDDTLGELGEVIDIVEDGGGVLLEVSDGKRRLLIPFVDAFLGEVDIAGRRIDLRLPEGLIETCASAS